MEALVLIIAELIFAPVAAAATALIEAMFLLISAFIELIANFVGISIVSKKRPVEAPESEAKQKPGQGLKVLAWVRWFFLLLFLAIVIIYLIIEFFLLDTGIDWALAKIEERSDITVEYSSVEASLIKGDFTFSGLTVHRQGNDKLNFDIKADCFVLDLAILSNPFSPASVKLVEITGVDGMIQREVKSDKRIKARKAFIIQQLLLTDINLDIVDLSSDKGPLEFNVNVLSMNSQPMRSNKAVFDVFFRSNVSGSVNGQDFLIETNLLPEGRETHWRTKAMPVASIAQFVGGPFAWLQTGTLDIKVDDYWQLDEKANIDMKWQFTFNGVKAEASTDLGDIKSKFADIVVNYINKQPDPFDIGFDLTMNENQFEGTSTLAAAGLWDAMFDGLTKNLASQTEHTQEQIKEGIDANLDKIKHYLDKRRKNTDE